MTNPPLKVLLGVSGGIAAIKSPEIVRRLREDGHQVRCILTRNAQSFVTPLTLEVLSGHPVLREEYLQANDSGLELHIEIVDHPGILGQGHDAIYDLINGL